MDKIEYLASIGDRSEWYAVVSKPRVSRTGGMRTRGRTGKVTVTHHRPTRRKLLEQAAARDAAIRAAREETTS
jgi:hypothetical protein